MRLDKQVRLNLQQAGHDWFKLTALCRRDVLHCSSFYLKFLLCSGWIEAACASAGISSTLRTSTIHCCSTAATQASSRSFILLIRWLYVIKITSDNTKGSLPSKDNSSKINIHSPGHGKRGHPVCCYTKIQTCMGSATLLQTPQGRKYCSY